MQNEAGWRQEMAKRRSNMGPTEWAEDDELESMLADPSRQISGRAENAVAGDAPASSSEVGDLPDLSKSASKKEGKGRFQEFIRRSWVSFATRIGAEQNPDVAWRSCVQLMLLSAVAFILIVLPILLADDRTVETEDNTSAVDGGIVPGGEESTSTKSGSYGAVACDDLPCAKLAVQVLSEYNGNAADAAVAAALCQGVVAPHASGLGGGAVITYYMMKGAKTGVIDAREVAPKRADERSASVGAALSTSSIGVPGELRGLYALQNDHGVLDWELLVGFAVEMANATTVSRVLANRLKEASEDIIASDDLRKVFAKEKVDKNDNRDNDDDYAVNQMDADYEVLHVGDTMSNPALMDTLKRIAKDPLALYDGLANTLVEDIRDGGGLLTRDDVVNYKIKEVAPTKTFYSGLQVITSSHSTSGALLVFALNFLEGFHLRKLGRNGDSYHLLAECLKYTFGWRAQFGDPDFDPAIKTLIEDQILSKQVAMNLRSETDMKETRLPGNYTAQELAFTEDHGTSHISVIDREGNAVSLSSSINYAFGSRFMSPRTGILLNNALVSFSPTASESGSKVPESSRNNLAPGKRSVSSLCPTIVLRNSKPYIAIGAGGGPMGMSALLQTLLNVLEFGQSVAQAVSAPRLHHQLVPGELRMEAIDDDTCAVLKTYKRSDGRATPSFWSDACRVLTSKGHNVTMIPMIGFSHAVIRIGPSTASEEEGEADDSTESLIFATGDARKQGVAAAY